MRLLLLGAESSGTRFTTRWLQSAGLDVTRYSLPYGPDHLGPRRWPTIEGSELLGESFDRVIVTVREPSFACPSQVANHAVTSEVAERNTSAATLSALQWADDHETPARIVVYEAVMAYPEMVARSLGDWLGVELPVPDVVDGDKKWVRT